MGRGAVCPPGGSEHLPDRHHVGGGVVPVEDRFDDLLVGSLGENPLDGDLFCPLVEPTRQEVAREHVGVGAVEEVFDLAQLGAEVGGDLPLLVDLNGVGEGVGHGCLWLT